MAELLMFVVATAGHAHTLTAWSDAGLLVRVLDLLATANYRDVDCTLWAVATHENGPVGHLDSGMLPLQIEELVYLAYHEAKLAVTD